jgi:predicted site-specific integrase-resolvase
MMYSPQKFSKKIGFSYEQVINMCRSGKVESFRTPGGHYKIPDKELDKFLNPDFISRDEYMKVVRENEKLKTILNQLKLTIEHSQA